MAQYKRILPQEQMIDIDFKKCKSIEELGIILNAIGFQVTEQWAKDNNLEHILVKNVSGLQLPNLG